MCEKLASLLFHYYFFRSERKREIMSKRKTHEEFIVQMSELHPEIIILGKYSGAFEKIKCKCTICGNIFERVPKEMTGKYLKGCPRCGINRRNANKIIPYETFKSKLDLLDNNIEIIGEYKNISTKTSFKCLTCNHKWEAQPFRILEGHGCPKCANNLKYTQDEYSNLLKKYHGNNISIISNYINAHTNAKFKCNICEYVWETKPSHLVVTDERFRTSCPNCFGTIKRTHEEFIDLINKINPNIIILGKYINNQTKIECKCKKCDGLFSMKPCHLIDGHGCRHCNSSIGENEIKKYLDEHNIKYEPQKYFNDLKGVGNRVLPYDFYLTEYNILIEFQGKQHENPVEYFGGLETFEVLKEHDRRKKEYAQKNNIKFIEIWYYDINRICEILDEALNSLELSA